MEYKRPFRIQFNKEIKESLARNQDEDCDSVENYSEKKSKTNKNFNFPYIFSKPKKYSN